MDAIATVVACVISGIVLYAAFPPLGFSFLCWFALVPLFLALAGKSARSGFLLSLLCGACFFLGIFNWILVVSGYKPLHHAILALYLGSYFGFFGLAFCLIGRRWGVGKALVAAPFLWVALEYIRSNLGFMALPWGLLAHSQYEQTSVIQIASLTGTYGVSFLIVLVNSAITVALLPVVKRFVGSQARSDQSSSRQVKIALISAATASVIFTVVYGHIKISQPISGKAIRISVVQGNIEQQKKWNPRYARQIMQTYSDLTREAAMETPDLIVWPETATPDTISRNPRLRSEVLSIAKKAGSPLLFGSAQHQKYGRRRSRRPEYVNSAFLINPNDSKGSNQRYDKILLFPFGEYLPMKKVIPWSLIKVPDVGAYVSGKEFTVFKLHDFRFSTTICWENMFPELVRQFVKRGAQFIINMTNEAWFGETAAPYQFVSMNVFRAVENKVYVIRCANTGISCFIDPCGRVINRVMDENGKDTFVRGTLSGSVIPQNGSTLYTRYGDLFAKFCLIVSMVFLVAAVLKKTGWSILNTKE